MALQKSPELEIPVVDLSVRDEELVRRAVVKASEEWGMFQVVNHGVSTELMQQLQEVGKQFFELPEAEKATLAKVDDFEGYERNYLEGIKAWEEHLFHRVWPPSSIKYRYWPKNPPNYREVNEEYTREMKKLGDKIMGWLSEGLGLPSSALKECIGGENAEHVIRINHYPPQCQESEVGLGAAEHTDMGAITLLVPNEVPGLQAFKDGDWFNLDYINSAVVVLIGDTTMMTSNGRYKSVLHRATVDKEKTRFSWPFFIGPTPDLIIGPFSELTGDKNPPKFETLLFKDYLIHKIKTWNLNKIPVYKLPAY